jgi:3'(2'), 5'-bisphosphate nucleotidase
VLGIIAVPARQLLWRGIAGQGAQRLTLGKGSAAKASSIRTRAVPPSGAVATVSRSHLDPATEALLSRIPVSERHAAGSALKFCLIAEGTADIYPRLSQTSEWDLAAGHALVCAAGGAVTTPEGGPMSYGKVKGQFLVPGFIACGDPAWAKSHLQKR